MSDIEFPNRRKLAAKLDTITPAADRHPHDSRVDTAADRHGFTSREPAEQPIRRDRLGATATLHTRAPVPVFNRFVRFCEENRMSYWQGIEELMNRSGVT
jgi:hypothetical protein